MAWLRRKSKLTVDTLSQFQLILLRFRRHRLAVVAFFMLVVLYLLAVFPAFFSPHHPRHRNLDYAYCPPHQIRFSLSRGLYAKGMRQHVDPVVLRKRYVDAPALDVPIGFFVKGYPYEILGLFRSTRHFIGVDLEEVQSSVPDQARAVYFLGADKYGRDILSRLIYGARISLSVGLIGVLVTLILGMIVGGISGYAGGTIDNLIQRFIEVVNSFPRLPMWLALGAAVPSDWSPVKIYFSITVALSLLTWTRLARVVRGKILSLREEDYAMAARLLGAKHSRIIFRHLLPGFTSHIIVSLTLSIPGMILGETSLSFLGLGLKPPIVSWGVMLQDCMDIKAVRFYPWLMAPVLMIMLAVLSFNFLGDGLRDASDPYAS